MYMYTCIHTLHTYMYHMARIIHVISANDMYPVHVQYLYQYSTCTICDILLTMYVHVYVHVHVYVFSYTVGGTSI